MNGSGSGRSALNSRRRRQEQAAEPLTSRQHHPARIGLPPVRERAVHERASQDLFPQQAGCLEGRDRSSGIARRCTFWSRTPPSTRTSPIGPLPRRIRALELRGPRPPTQADRQDRRRAAHASRRAPTASARRRASPIGLKRLDARPIATLSLEAQERHERREKVFRED